MGEKPTRAEKYLVSAVVAAIGGILVYFGNKRDDQKGDIMFKTGMGFVGVGVYKAMETAEILPKKDILEENNKIFSEVKK